MISALILALLCSFVLRLRAKFGCFFFSSVCSRESGQECLCEVLLLFFEFLYLCVRVGFLAHPQKRKKGMCHPPLLSSSLGRLRFSVQNDACAVRL